MDWLLRISFLNAIGFFGLCLEGGGERIRGLARGFRGGERPLELARGPPGGPPLSDMSEIIDCLPRSANVLMLLNIPINSCPVAPALLFFEPLPLVLLPLVLLPLVLLPLVLLPLVLLPLVLLPLVLLPLVPLRLV